MKLMSCDNCGVILNAEKLKFPSCGFNEEGIDTYVADYDQETREYRVYVSCPVCDSKIFGDRV